MKFISKSSNLLIVLRPGFSAQPLTGTPAKPTVSVRFKDGVADVQQEELVQMMLAHPAFNGDFISAESVPSDPYALMRQSSEPAHIVTEMKFGTPISRATKGGTSHLPPELQKIVQDMATEMAKSMLPSLLENTLKGLVEAHEADKKPSVAGTPTKVKGKPGRKPKVRTEEKVVENITATPLNPATQEEVS